MAVVLIQDIVNSKNGAWLSHATLRLYSLAEQCQTNEFFI